MARLVEFQMVSGSLVSIPCKSGPACAAKIRRGHSYQWGKLTLRYRSGLPLWTLYEAYIE